MPRFVLMVLLASGVVFGYGSALGLIDVGSPHHCPHREAATLSGEAGPVTR